MIKCTLWPNDLCRVLVMNLNLSYNFIWIYSSITTSIATSYWLTELKTFKNNLLLEADFWSNSLLNRFSLTCQCFVTMTICKLGGIQRKFSDFGGVFQTARWKTQANFYISWKKNISTPYSHKTGSIQLRPHNEKSFCNYRLKLAIVKSPSKDMFFAVTAIICNRKTD